MQKPLRPILAAAVGGLIPESAGSYVKRPSSLFWPPVFTREKDICPPCANLAPAAAAQCASSRSFGAGKNRCRAHHRGSRPHDTPPVRPQTMPPAAPCRPGPNRVCLSIFGATHGCNLVKTHIFVGITERIYARLKHHAYLHPHPRGSRCPNGLRTFPIG